MILRGAAYALAALGFALAGALSNGPRLPATGAPEAADVRRARDTAIAFAAAVMADGEPRAVTLGVRDLASSAALTNHGLDWLRVRPRLVGDRLSLEADLQLAASTWLNVEACVASSEAFPEVGARIGAWSIPAPVTRAALRGVDRVLAWRGRELPPLESMIQHLDVGPEAVTATVAVPQQLVQVARNLLGSGEGGVDPELLAGAYRHLLAAQRADPTRSLAVTLQRAFAARPAGADAVEHNRAAFVALALVTVGRGAGRLAGDRDVVAALPHAEPFGLRLSGRDDLAKHFILSAAMGTAIDPRLTRAIGEWKELDDSLPGGSGFSFVDLTADRAGLHIGRAAVDPATAEAVSAGLAQATDAALFPAAAHELEEGLSDRRFRASYGDLGTMSYAEAVRRVDRLLADLPLYRPLVSR